MFYWEHLVTKRNIWATTGTVLFLFAKSRYSTYLGTDLVDTPLIVCHIQQVHLPFGQPNISTTKTGNGSYHGLWQHLKSTRLLCIPVKWSKFSHCWSVSFWEFSLFTRFLLWRVPQSSPCLVSIASLEPKPEHARVHAAVRQDQAWRVKVKPDQ